MRKLRVLLAISFMVLMGVHGSALAAGPLTHVTTVPLGAKAHDVVLQDDFAYVVTDLGLTIVDVSNPAAPVVRGSVSTGKTQGVAVKGSYVYVASQTKDLRIIDISDPDAPTIIGFEVLPGQTWDVAVKDNIVYAASFGGELYLINISNPQDPILVKRIGLLKWSNPGADALNLEKLNNYVTSGNALTTGVSVTGNALVTVDWGYGRLYYYDVANAANPIFRGTHYAPFLLKAEADPVNDVAYMLGAYGKFSGLFTVPISAMGSTYSTRYDQCPSCDFLPANHVIGQGGLAVSTNGKYVLYVGGGKAQLHVVDVSIPADRHEIVSVSIGEPQVGLAETIGLTSRGDYIYVAGGATGLQVYLFSGLSD
ncbi:LVIVD repeat protein [Candidatus Methylomirabilis lanthanidiphila]|uniref:LVIVD repeat protein n=1 Tax=Candidatus Methylomirabilis lanthanidiphila TaxID=2211376 RepID=A0A564ZL12_9BACT|nr:hypothetical protein [Candidatus Methylomirabilis lanthanidiphila]VUZ86011.1 LVIVD repeat protein [Candidatus Methylomirabilis lanthanidiphila]